MANSIYLDRQKRVRRVFGALVIAIFLIAGAYVVSDPSLLNIFSTPTANAQSTQELLAAFAQQKGPDGKPLWEDELIATSSSTPFTASSTPELFDASTTPDAGSGTLTDQFAQSVFEQYITQLGGNEPSDDDINTFAQNAIDTLVQDHSEQDKYSSSDETVSGTGPHALTAYAAAASQALDSTTFNTSDNEVDYFAQAVEKNDPTALKEVAAIGQAYTNLAPALMQVSVPTEAQYAHLEIANAAARLGEDITDMSVYNTDPLRAYIGLNAWQTDAPALLQGFSDMDTVFQNEGVTIPSNASGYDFYSIVTSAGPTATSTSQ